MKDDSETNVREPVREITLNGLGPLSNPRIFRAYAALFTGLIVVTWTEFFLHEKYVFVISQFAVFLATGCKTVKSRDRLPEAAKVTLSTCVGALAFAVPVCVGWAAYRSDFDLPALVQIVTYSTISAGWILLSFGPLTATFLRRPNRKA